MVAIECFLICFLTALLFHKVNLSPIVCPENAVLKNGECTCQHGSATFFIKKYLICFVCPQDCGAGKEPDHECSNFTYEITSVHEAVVGCRECKKGYFSYQSRCYACERRCDIKLNEYEFEDCSPTQNRICKCNRGWYRDTGSYNCERRCSLCVSNDPRDKVDPGQCSESPENERCIDKGGTQHKIYKPSASTVATTLATTTSEESTETAVTESTTEGLESTTTATAVTESTTTTEGLESTTTTAVTESTTTTVGLESTIATEITEQTSPAGKATMIIETTAVFVENTGHEGKFWTLLWIVVALVVTILILLAVLLAWKKMRSRGERSPSKKKAISAPLEISMEDVNPNDDDVEESVNLLEKRKNSGERLTELNGQTGLTDRTNLLRCGNDADSGIGGSLNGVVMQGPPRIMHEICQMVLHYVAESLGIDWQKLGRLLKVSETELRTINNDYKGTYNQTIEMLKTWKNSSTVNPLWHNLCKSLIEIELGNIVKRVENKIKDCQSCKKNRGEELLVTRSNSLHDFAMHDVCHTILHVVATRINDDRQKLGRMVMVQEEIIEGIEHDHKTSYDKSYYILMAWSKLIFPTWGDLRDALENIKRNDIIRDVEVDIRMCSCKDANQPESSDDNIADSSGVKINEKSNIAASAPSSATNNVPLIMTDEQSVETDSRAIVELSTLDCNSRDLQKQSYALLSET